MGKTGISIGLAVAALVALPTEARADCIDPYECVCRATTVVATGTVKTAPVTTSDGEITIDRIQFTASSQGTLPARAGDTVKITNLPQGTVVGARVLATGPLVSGELRIIRVLDGSPVACTGTTFTEAEVVDLEFSTGTTCRDRAKERIEAPDCDDTNSCAITRAGSSNAGHGVLFGLALAGGAIVARRRLSRR